MGCTSSKIDDFPAVALCRDRCNYLDEAIHYRYALAEAHLAYVQSLNSVGHSLNHFFHQKFDLSEPVKEPPIGNSDSTCCSHLEFHSDSDDDDVSGDTPTTPLGNLGLMHMNFMRNQVTPSVTYEQNPNFYDNYYGSIRYGIAPSEVGPEPPAPPSPPRSSPWEFLNPFETFENNYPSFRSSRDSREVREEEGIPDLESVDFENKTVKEVPMDHQKNEESEVQDVNTTQVHQSRTSSSTENDPVEYEVHVVDKNVVDEKENKGNVAGFKCDSDVMKEIQGQFERAFVSGNDLAKVLEVGKLPHNRKHATYQVSSKMLHMITPSIAIVPEPSSPKNAAIEIGDSSVLDVEGDISSRPINISSTLQKLYLWEKKLYEEVKSEEKTRVLHERKSYKLKQLNEKGAELHKVDMTRKLVTSLSSKIRIAMQVVDRVSEKINKLRDEELWPQLNELIQGLSRMWKCMLECHRNQSLAIGEAKQLDAIASHKQSSDAHLEASLQLEHELLNWTLRFSCWVSAQKGYVRALNNWLMKCLLYVPEETADGLVPFSPSRIGAPPIFVICNHWSQALGSVSEKVVIDCMRDFATNILQLWERDKLEFRQRMMANKDMERQIKNLEREDLKIQKGIHALDKRIVLVSGEENGLSLNSRVVYQSETSKNSSLKVGLQRIFEAMEAFTSNSLKVYEELLQRIDKDKFTQEPETVS